MGVRQNTLSLKGTGSGVSKGRVTWSCVDSGLKEQFLSDFHCCSQVTRARGEFYTAMFKLMCVSIGTLFEWARQGLWAELRGEDCWAQMLLILFCDFPKS